MTEFPYFTNKKFNILCGALSTDDKSPRITRFQIPRTGSRVSCISPGLSKGLAQTAPNQRQRRLCPGEDTLMWLRPSRLR